MPQRHYSYASPFDRAKFQAGVRTKFSRSGRYNAAAMPDLLRLLGMIERDHGIRDIRYAAYMLATVMWETTFPTTVVRQKIGKSGQPVVDKHGQPVMLRDVRWQMTMAPVSEVGHGEGRNYHEPVKVKLLADGNVRITEQDGDQFTVTDKGAITPLTSKAKMGTKDGGKAVQTYDEDDGAEHAYYGRGYVQLTWWSNYAKAGVALGKGLQLLLSPNLVTAPQVAYALMSHGMRKGEIFANGHMLSKYFNAAHTDYIGARRMVNGTDHAGDIATIAAGFEDVLLQSRPVTAPLHVAAMPRRAP